MCDRLSRDGALLDFLGRLGASQGAPVRFRGHDLAGWPPSLVKALKDSRLLVPVPPAQSTVCPGCEDACAMPVYGLPHESEADPFIVCERRSDTHHVPIPAAALEQWQASPEGLARTLAGLLGIPYSGRSSGAGALHEVGLLRGGKHASHVQLQLDGRVALRLAGHVVPVIEVLRLEGDAFKVDHRTLFGLVDAPVGPAGGKESAEARRSRLHRWITEEKAMGNKAFQKVVAEREGISPQRLKQILAAK